MMFREVCRWDNRMEWLMVSKAAVRSRRMWTESERRRLFDFKRSGFRALSSAEIVLKGFI